MDTSIQDTNTLLNEHLDKVRQVFDTDKLLQQDVDERLVVDYYKQSDYGYRVYHSESGAIHMALNYDGVFDADGYYGQASIVQEHIGALRPESVLELASGKGFNSVYLAKQNPGVRFEGIELTPKFLSSARKKAKNVPNLEFVRGSFERLPYPSDAFELGFVVESLCHASNMSLALSEASRVLKPGGHLVLFDGFRERSFEGLDPDLKTAADLVAAAMAVKEFQAISDWLNLARNAGFEVLEVRNLSDAIYPTLMRLEELCTKYFANVTRARLMLRTMPKLLVQNAIVGLLLPILIRAGVYGYYQVILSRR